MPPAVGSGSGSNARVADWKQAELRHARIGIYYDAVWTLQLRTEFAGECEAGGDRAGAWVIGVQMFDARIGGEQFGRFSIRHEDDARVGKTLLHRGQDRADDFDIGAQGDAREDVYGIDARGYCRLIAGRLESRRASAVRKLPPARGRTNRRGLPRCRGRIRRGFSPSARICLSGGNFAPPDGLRSAALTGNTCQLSAPASDRGGGHELLIGDQRVRQRRSAFAFARSRHGSHGFRHHPAAFAAFCVRTRMMSVTSTASCSGCQQS